MKSRTVVLLSVLGLRPALADDAGAGPWLDRGAPPLADAASEPTITSQRRALAVTAAVVPGVLVRGLGSYLVYQPPAGRRLAVTAAIGLGAMAVGGVPLIVTAGNPYTIVPGAQLVIAGAGLFMSTWISDIWIAAGGERIRATPRAPTPWSLELGSMFVRDPLRDRELVHGAGRIVFGRVELGAGGYAALGGDELAADLETRVRVLGAPWTGAAIADGTRLSLRAAAGYRDDDDDQVQIGTFEAEAELRVDLRHLTHLLDDTFIEMSTGFGLERTRYPTDASETDTLLLARFAWGLYLGRRGEATAFYDHRRDHFAGGIPAGRAAGFVGSIGATLDTRIVGRWAARAGIEYGSAWVGTLALRYQGGPP